MLPRTGSRRPWAVGVGPQPTRCLPLVGCRMPRHLVAGPDARLPVCESARHTEILGCVPCLPLLAPSPFPSPHGGGTWVRLRSHPHGHWLLRLALRGRPLAICFFFIVFMFFKL